MCSNDSKAVAGVTHKKGLVSVVGDEHIEINDEYWSLWNSNNMSMLNITRENYGDDGSRIELGNASKLDCGLILSVDNFEVLNFF